MRFHFRPALIAVLGIAILPATPRAPAQSSDPDQPFMEAYRSAEPITTWPMKKILHEIPELKGLEPAADQSALPGTLAQAAATLENFWKNFQNTSSLETIDESRQTRQRSAGAHPEVDEAVREFRYLMLTDPDNPLHIKEYRTDLHGRPRSSELAVSGFLQTSGFTSLPLIFGSREQHLTDYRYLGSQRVHDQACKVVAFAQHDTEDAVSRWSIEGQQIPVLIQGVAWIDAEGGEVVQIRTDLLAPQPRVSLGRATTVVRFAPVQFHKARGVFWLPQEVTVSIDLDAYTFVNRHRYSQYQVFTVLTSESSR